MKIRCQKDGEQIGHGREDQEKATAPVEIGLAYEKFGHLSLRPSNQRIYNSSAIGLFLVGLAPSSDVVVAVFTVFTGGAGTLGTGSPLTPPPPPPVPAAPPPIPISSSSSVTTKPRAVISLRRTTRLCGTSPARAVCTCCRTAELSLMPWRMSSTTRYASSGAASARSVNPRASMLSASISRASIPSWIACGAEAGGRWEGGRV